MKKAAGYLFQIYVWLIVYPIGWLLTIITALLVTFFSLLGFARFSGRYIASSWGKLVLWITPVKTRLKGLENIDKSQSYVIVSNHQSIYDILAVYGYLPLDFKWVMKAELRKMPFVGFACYKMGHIFVDRSKRRSSIDSLKDAKQRLGSDTSVFFFPEGTRSMSSEMITFKKGAYKMAKDLNLPILPLSISGANHVMATGKFMIRPGTITMTFHAPIALEMIDDLAIDELIQQSRATIASAIE